MIEATNQEDSDTFLAAFGEDATVDDFGRSFVGHAEIAGWNDRENIGVHARFDIIEVAQSGSTTTVRLTVSGDGHNGPSTFVFKTADDLITRTTISA